MGSARSSEIEGMRVIAQAGREVGEVTGLEVDLDDFTIHSVEIKLRREVLEALDLKVPLMGTHTIKVEMTHVSAIGDTVVLGATLEQLATISAKQSKKDE
jgi:sporulation protein YlmC with PRC-barrel domain